MTLRTLAREIKDFPATFALGFCWLVVFGLMAADELRFDPSPSWWRMLIVGAGNGHRFGDLTLDDLMRGEYWRLLTATFVHFSVLHIGLNLLAFYLVGTLIESWYGPGQLVFIYALTGGLGNLGSAIVRRWMGANPQIHSGGGSVVVMGLISLCAVVGWKLRTEMGRELGSQMAKALGMTALLGLVFPRYIDNLGHAGGALVGLPLGMLHRRWVRDRERPAAWGRGAIAAAVIGLCAWAQVSANQREAPEPRDRHDGQQRRRLEQALGVVRLAALLGDQGLDARRISRTLRSEMQLRGGSWAQRDDFRGALSLAMIGQVRPLTDEERNQLDRCLGSLAAESLSMLGILLDFPALSSDYREARRLAETAATKPLSEGETAEYRKRLKSLRGHIEVDLRKSTRDYWRGQRASLFQARRRSGPTAKPPPIRGSN